jgi:release factor glutamine methyltransferase
MTVDEALAASGLPRAEALLLLAHASGWSRERLIAASREPLPSTTGVAFVELARRRVAGEPIAYLVGSREFYGRRFRVDRRVLIPRPETELLVDHALQWIGARRASRVLDLGCGSGIVAITIALELPALDVVATDRSVDALTVAADNATHLGAVVRFAAGDWYDAVPGEAAFDLIVSNPPYVAADDPHLADGDLRFEPSIALTDRADGTTDLRRIVAGARGRLAAGGALIVEHGHRQATAVRMLLADAGFEGIGSRRDLSGIERISFGSLALPTPPRVDL